VGKISTAGADQVKNTETVASSVTSSPIYVTKVSNSHLTAQLKFITTLVEAAILETMASTTIFIRNLFATFNDPFISIVRTIIQKDVYFSML